MKTVRDLIREVLQDLEDYQHYFAVKEFDPIVAKQRAIINSLDTEPNINKVVK
jgi:hypothetical protein